jgi:BirA family biotin operon repressor/biotin-[acetyl-CoA-carboxylase] ligase
MKDYTVKLSIIEQLSSGEFKSGESLGRSLGMSRAAVSKQIKSMSDLGLDVFSVPGRGYMLAKPIELLDLTWLSKQCVAPIHLYPIIDSTNKYLLARVSELESGETCLAEFQSAGKGRRGRDWVSPFGSNLYLSMYWRLEAGIAAAMGLSLVVGVAIADALTEYGVNNVKLKWPNDIYVDDRKLAGILVELSGQAGDAADLVIGLGLNLNMSDSVQGITQPWIALESAVDGEIERNKLTAAIIQKLHTELLQYESFGMSGMVERWNKYDNYMGKPIKLIMGERVIEGVAKGIESSGAIQIETNKGIESFIGGEISLRPL